MRFIFLIISLFFVTTGIAQQTQWQWARSGEDAGLSWANEVVCDESGNTYAVGRFSNTITLGSYSLTSAGLTDVFVVKYTSFGQVIWALRMGGYNEDDAMGICKDDGGNIYVTGKFFDSSDFGYQMIYGNGLSDIFISKLDSSGNFIWTKTWGGVGYDECRDLCFNNGYICCTGRYNDTVSFDNFILTSGSNPRIFVMKLDTSGNVNWAKNATGALPMLGIKIASDIDGNILIAGTGTTTSMSFDAITITNADMFVAKYDINGNAVWANAINCITNFAGYVTVTSNEVGDIYVAGYTGIEVPISFGPDTLYDDNTFLAKYSSSGTFLWAKNVSFHSNGGISNIVSDHNNGIYISGYYGATGVFGNDTLAPYGNHDIMILKLDNNGTNIWATRAGGTGVDRAYGITINSDNEIVTCGFTGSPSSEFGSNSLFVSPGNGWDMFVAKLSQTTGVRVTPAVNKQLWGYPNPAGEVFYVNSVKEGVLYELHSITGSIIANGTLHQGINQLSLADLSAGMYILRAETETFKIIKK